MKLNAYESALFCVQMARDNLRGLPADLRAQLADIRLKSVEETLRGKIDPTEYENKILGSPSRTEASR